MTRRRFLELAGSTAVASALPGRLFAQEAGTVTISLLHTTDLHGHILPTSDYHGRPNLGGLARCASQIGAWRQACAHSLLLDIGDVYQGTAVSWADRGAVMMRLLNALKYDAWVVGNHEFDWGADVFAARVADSAMPVLSGNALLSGKPSGTLAAGTGPFAKVRPWLMKEVAGFRLAIVGLTTPALSTWSPPEFLRDYESLDPIQSLRSILDEVAAQKPDAIILAGHMGLVRRDDLANQIGEITRDFPQIAVCLGGHTHQDHPGEISHGVLYTQADHFGIHAGKVDLTFDRSTRQLVDRHALTVLMDATIPFDPLVMSLAQTELAAAEKELARTAGTLGEPFRASTVFGRPGEQERLIGSAVKAALQKQGMEIDVVIHGLFDERREMPPGTVTVADVWRFLPYENQVVTFEASGADLTALAQEIAAARDLRQVMGVRVITAPDGSALKVVELRTSAGAPIDPGATYRVAVNSYDSQSGGGKLPLLGRLVAAPGGKRVLHATQTREATIDFFTSRGTVNRAVLLL